MRRVAFLLLALVLVPAASAALAYDVTRRYEAGVSGYVDFALVQAGLELPCNDTTVLCFEFPPTSVATFHVRDDTGFWGSALVRWGAAPARSTSSAARGVSVASSRRARWCTLVLRRARVRAARS